MIIIISFLASLLSSMSGAGASLVATPLFVSLGFPLQTVITSNCINGALWTPLAAANYLKGRKLDLPLLGGLVFFGLLGASLGTASILSLNEKTLKISIGLIIISLSTYVFFRKGFGLTEHEPRIGRPVASLLALPLGFYEAFFAAGNGIFTSLCLSWSRGFDLIRALGSYYVIAFFWCSFASVIYLHQGLWNSSLMTPAAIGSVAGGYIGSRIGKAKGSVFVKRLFTGLGIVLGIKLLISGLGIL